ncbi:hypothetical protein AW736_00045 [Termitidicoccus mucosus]|uniref:Uncharacterized protein n=1 Tax=Termitidicoccus mucosus TaxID=1184151 RepID=A0A178IAV8_9BACT|nr:hypothetical protein AW736_24165 [Opitutaceae bacterium TSB47]OAM91245.1 hypothetical protein AW736_00045 [Opitutaceae bacterium TSB47]
MNQNDVYIAVTGIFITENVILSEHDRCSTNRNASLCVVTWRPPIYPRCAIAPMPASQQCIIILELCPHPRDILNTQKTMIMTPLKIAFSIA